MSTPDRNDIICEPFIDYTRLPSHTYSLSVYYSVFAPGYNFECINFRIFILRTGCENLRAIRIKDKIIDSHVPNVIEI